MTVFSQTFQDAQLLSSIPIQSQRDGQSASQAENQNEREKKKGESRKRTTELQ